MSVPIVGRTESLLHGGVLAIGFPAFGFPAGFTSGSIDTKNMLGRYLYTSIAPDGTAWMINNSARIVCRTPCGGGIVFRRMCGPKGCLSIFPRWDVRARAYSKP